jgi:hypothetical protein
LPHLHPLGKKSLQRDAAWLGFSYNTTVARGAASKNGRRRFCFRLARWRPTSHIGKKLDHRVTRRHSGAFVERATASLLERNAPGRVGEKDVSSIRPSASAAACRISTRSSCSSSARRKRHPTKAGIRESTALVFTDWPVKPGNDNERTYRKSLAGPAGVMRPSHAHARHFLCSKASVAMLASKSRADPIAGSDSSC